MSNKVEVTAANFKREVLESVLPVLVEFWSESSKTSELMTSVLDEIALEHRDRLKLVRVNVEQNPELAGHHHVESIPTLLYYYNGLIHDQLVGLASKTVINTRLKSLVAKT